MSTATGWLPLDVYRSFEHSRFSSGARCSVIGGRVLALPESDFAHLPSYRYGQDPPVSSTDPHIFIPEAVRKTPTGYEVRISVTGKNPEHVLDSLGACPN